MRERPAFVEMITAVVLGGIAEHDKPAPRALDALFTLAERSNLPVDLHLDEHMEPSRTLAPMVAEAVIARGLQARVTFSHLCVLSALAADPARALIDKIAAAEITVIALPETNLLSLERIVLGQIVIAEQIKTGSVELVGSRFRCQVDDAARRSAELRRECTAEDLKLLQGLHCERRRNLHMPAPVCIGVIAAIHIDVRE